MLKQSSRRREMLAFVNLDDELRTRDVEVAPQGESGSVEIIKASVGHEAITDGLEICWQTVTVRDGQPGERHLRFNCSEKPSKLIEEACLSL